MSTGGEPPVPRVLITGGAGTVAGWLVRTAPPGVEVHVTERRSAVPDDVRARASVHPLDLIEAATVLDRVQEIRPDVVVHAAYTMGDRADIVEATANVAAAASSAGAELVHLSTDVVFAGDDPPYAESDPVAPVSDYGVWKAEAERIVRATVPDACITRTSLVVSTDPPDTATHRFAEMLRGGGDVTLFGDEFREPIRADDLAAELWALMAIPTGDRAGIWHLPGPERLSRLELGLRTATALGLDASRIRSASAAEHPSPRPRDLVLVSGRRAVLGVTLRPVAT